MSLPDAYSRLKAFRDNFPDKSNFGVSSDYVHEYHDIVTMIQKVTGLDLQQYMIPDEAVSARVTSANMMSGKKTYSSETYCKKEFFKMKVDGLLNRFELLLNQPEPEEKKHQIGFKTE